MEGFNDDLNINSDSQNNAISENLGEISGFDDNKAEVDTNSGFYSTPHSNIIQDDFSDDFNNNEENDVFEDSPYKNPIKKKSKKKYGLGIVVIAVVLAAVTGFVGSLVTLKFNKNDVTVDLNSLPKVAEKSESKTSLSTENKSGDVASIAQAVANKCSKSVVGIRTTTSVISFFGGTSESTGEGSGIIYTSDGYVITNYHVVENAVRSSKSSKIEVFFDNANTDGSAATVVGYNIAADLAVLKVEGNNLPNIEIGNSSDLSVGQYVVTIGAPGGLEFMGSVTYGIISGLDRVVSSNSEIGLIQTDAAINPGNSGGALIDEKGKLIGVNSSKIVSEEFEGMGFAIPVNTAVEICNGIIANKDKKEPYVGITISEKYTSDVLKAYDYPVGAVVLSVASDSTAQECGIKKGDIITEFNGTQITEYDVFANVLSQCTPGSEVDITIYRSGKYYEAKIEIGSNS